MKGDIKRDTAVFGLHQFYIEGYEGPMFSTEHDAKQALHVAGQRWLEARDELADKIRECLP